MEGVTTGQVAARKRTLRDDRREAAWKIDLSPVGVSRQREVERMTSGVQQPRGLVDEKDGGACRIPVWSTRVRVPREVVIESDQEGTLKRRWESMTAVGQERDAGLFEHGTDGCGTGPVIMVSQYREHAERRPEGT